MPTTADAAAEGDVDVDEMELELELESTTSAALLSADDMDVSSSSLTLTVLISSLLFCMFCSVPTTAMRQGFMPLLIALLYIRVGTEHTVSASSGWRGADGA